MKKIILSLTILSLVISGVVLAQGINNVTPSGKTVVLPDKVTDNSRVLQKITFIHYKKGFVKPGTECGNGICEPGENANKCPSDCGGTIPEDPVADKCFGFMAKGLQIKSPKTLAIHPDLASSVIWDAASEWDANTSANLFSGFSIDENANWEQGVSDGKNEFSLYDYPEEGVIGVANVWGYFTGPPQLREIVEFDIMFDTDYVWGNADITTSTVMDLQNIATHEIGHAVGLTDMYDTACSEVTMYGYSGYGETKKRSLELADIAGLQSLYGN